MVHLDGSHLRSLSLRAWVCHPNTRIYVRLLGPCFKTGRLKPLRQHPKRGRAELSEYEKTRRKMHALYAERSHSTQSALPESTRCETSVHATVSLQGYNTAEAATFPRSFVQQSKLMLTCRWKSASLTPKMKQSRPCGLNLTTPHAKTDFPPAWLVSNVSLSTISRTV